MTDVKITYSEVQAAQKVVANAVEEMNNLARLIQGQSDASTTAMQADAGDISSNTYVEMAGQGQALAEVLAELQADLGKLQVTANDGSTNASRAARGVTPPTFTLT